MKKNWTGFSPAGVDTPQRLSEITRNLAKRYLSGEIGRTMSHVAHKIPDDFYLQMPTNPAIYAMAIRLIAQNAPLRILPEELLIGAATLKEAATHCIPGLGIQSVSHTTIGFERALQIGYNGIKREIEERLASDELDTDGTELLQAMLSCMESAAVWKQRYIAELESQGRNDLLKTLKRVPENPPENFREAVQSLWLLWDFQRLCGNWSGIGRIDKMLGPYLLRDLKNGKFSLDEARELLAHFWIKGCEWITADGNGSGDAQFYQNIVLAGIDEHGDQVANEVTDLVLDVVEELHIADFPIAVRVSTQTDERLLQRIAAVQRLGGGIIAVYNEDRIIPALENFGYPPDEAADFANDGCWEILIPGKTCFAYQPFDALQLLQDTLRMKEDVIPEYTSFEELYNNFVSRMARTLTGIINDHSPARNQATVLIDLLMDGCIDKGRSYYDLGPKYTVVSPHPGGLPDVANSLLAIKKLVYIEKKFTLPQLVNILRNDWQDHESERRLIRERINFYGNDSAEADSMMQQVFNDFTGLVEKVPLRNGILRPAGISTFGRESDYYLPYRMATAAGNRKGDILALNFSPSPGTDKNGPTAVIKSHCSVDFSRLPCGTALELKVLPSSVRGSDGLTALTGLIKTFVRLGGIFMQIDVVDTAMLRDAQTHPEKYPNLAVRISGWSARFATLSHQWQEMVITRSEQKL